MFVCARVCVICARDTEGSVNVFSFWFSLIGVHSVLRSCTLRTAIGTCIINVWTFGTCAHNLCVMRGRFGYLV